MPKTSYLLKMTIDRDWILKCVVLIGACSLSALSAAQSSVASYNGTHAIVGAKIEIGDGRVIEKGTVVIKDGILVSVSSDGAVPRGAEVVDGKGLTLYPGFIDCYTTKGYSAPSVKLPGTDPNGDIANFASAFMRETVRPGIKPEVLASQGLTLGDDVLKSYQSSGFTTAMIFPSGGDISGMGALVNLSGRPNRECIVLPRFGESISFGSNSFGEGYPSSLMGHVAQIRQAFSDAGWYASLQRSFDAGGAKRPPADESITSLQSLIGGRVPSILEADSAPQIQRALNLSSEFGLKSILAGGGEAWKMIEAIKSSGAPILLTLPFGTEPGLPPKKTDVPPPTDLPVPEVVNPAKVAERRRIYEESVKNASLLTAAGIPIGLTTKGNATPTAFMENLRKAVKAGLSREAALKALTVDAAKVFGVERQLGTLEVGKTANVIVMTGDFLDAQVKVKYLYIDGRKIDPSKGVPPPTFRPRFSGEVGL